MQGLHIPCQVIYVEGSRILIRISPHNDNLISERRRHITRSAELSGHEQADPLEKQFNLCMQNIYIIT